MYGDVWTNQISLWAGPPCALGQDINAAANQKSRRVDDEI